METQHTSRTRLAVRLSEEAHALLAGGNENSEALEKTLELRMIVRPSSRADLRPAICFIRTNHPDPDVSVICTLLRLNRLIQHAADLHWPVSSGAQQVEGCDARQGTDLMHHRGAAIKKKRSIRSIDSALGCSNIPSPKLCVTGESTPSKTA